MDDLLVLLAYVPPACHDFYHSLRGTAGSGHLQDTDDDSKGEAGSSDEDSASEDD